MSKKFKAKIVQENITASNKSIDTPTISQDLPKKNSNGCNIATFAIILCIITFGTTFCDSTNDRIRDSSRSYKVRNSSWDGSVLPVKEYLKKVLKDPKSIEYIEWFPVQEIKGGNYKVRLKYRAKNSFGGYILSDQLFFLNSDGIVTNQTEL